MIEARITKLSKTETLTRPSELPTFEFSGFLLKDGALPAWDNQFEIPWTEIKVALIKALQEWDPTKVASE
jgi:hypothetical protein